MSVFPNIQPDFERRLRKRFVNMVRVADGGIQMNVPHPLEPFLFHLEWNSTLVDTDLDTILAHYDANRNVTFTYFEFSPRAISGLFVGTGNGAAGQVITLPAKNISGLVIQVNGSTVANYTTAPGAGADGETTITSTGGGFANNGTITMNASDVTTQRRHYVWYTTDQVEEVPVEANLYSLVLDLEEKVP